MKKAFLLVTSMLAGAALMQGQTLVSNVGGNITVQNGAILTIEGTLENTTGGTIDNQGTIILEGDLMNDATFTSADPSVLRFEGADTSRVTSGTAIFNNVEIAKDATNVVQLLDPMTVGGTMTFDLDDNQVVIGDHNLVMQDGASFAGYDDNQFVVTNGLGYVRMEDVDNAAGPLVYPVGFNSSTYNPATITPQAGHSEVDDIDVRVLENAYEDGLTGTQIAEGVVNATWEINEGTPGGSDVNMELQWHHSDTAAGFPNNANGISRYDDVAMNWDMEFGDIGAAIDEGAGNWSQSRANVMEFSPFAVGGEEVAHALGLDVRVLLSGPYNAGTNLMGDGLRTTGIIPTNEPYQGLAGYSHVGFGGGSVADPVDFDQTNAEDDIVDWVVVELRNSATPTSVMGTQEALIQRDGDIVSMDGASPVYVKGLPDDDYHVAVRHRNHLGIRTPNGAPLSLDGDVTSYDFTVDSLAAYANTGAPMIELETDVWGMWGANVKIDAAVRMFGPLTINDYASLLAYVGSFSNTVFDTYNEHDVNMDGDIRMFGPLTINDYAKMLSIVGAFNVSILQQL